MKKLLILLFIVVLTSCNFSDETRTLSGGWTFVSEARHDRVIEGGNIFIPCEVIKYGYNKDFIVAAQKPTEECFLGKDTFEYKLGRDTVYYWLIKHSSKIFLGPMDEEEYLQARIRYKVPENLKLKSLY